jgi:hypothetical protein
MSQEVIEVTEREVEVVEIIERGPAGPAGTGLETLTTQGDILYQGLSSGQRLPIGTAGQILKVNSGETAPEWGEAPVAGVTSVGVTGSDGIEVDSGSPVTGSGSIALGVNAATLRSHINVADGAEVNVQSNWTEVDSGSDAFILNKPTLGTAAASDTGDFAAASHTHLSADVTDATSAATADVIVKRDANGGAALQELIVNVPTGSGKIQYQVGGFNNGNLAFDSDGENMTFSAGNQGGAFVDGPVMSFGRDGITFTGSNVATQQSNTRTALGLGTAAVEDSTAFAAPSDIPDPSSATPQALGTAAAGTSDDYSRADHVHPLAGLPIEYVIACSDETSDLTTGTAKVTFRTPVTFLLTGVAASVNTAPTGSTLIVDINNGANSALSTKLSIDASEKTSATAATPAAIDTTYDDFAADAEITIDIDQVGSTIAGKGLKVVLKGTRA